MQFFIGINSHLLQHVITKDNVSIAVDGAMTIKVVDSWKSCYNAVNPADMLVSVANGIIRKIVGTMNVDDLYHNRDTINKAVCAFQYQYCGHRGLQCLFFTAEIYFRC